MKIQIIGYSGSGKSTLAKTLSELYELPILYLDNVKFYGDWEERTTEEQIEIVKQFLANNENWVIDGNYSKICPERFELSDKTIYMNFNRIKCFISAYKRYKKHKSIHRESCNCKDKFDHSFRKWLLFDGRTKERKQKHISNLNKTKGEKIILKNRRQVNNFIKKCKKELGLLEKNG